MKSTTKCLLKWSFIDWTCKLSTMALVASMWAKNISTVHFLHIYMAMVWPNQSDFTQAIPMTSCKDTGKSLVKFLHQWCRYSQDVDNGWHDGIHWAAHGVCGGAKQGGCKFNNKCQNKDRRIRVMLWQNIFQKKMVYVRISSNEHDHHLLKMSLNILRYNAKAGIANGDNEPQYVSDDSYTHGKKLLEWVMH